LDIHPDLMFLDTFITTDVATGKKVLACNNAMPNMAREHLKMLNRSLNPEVVEEKFRIYFNEKLRQRMFYCEKNKKSFRVNNFNIRINDGWVPAPSHKMKTPRIVKHAVL